MMALLPGQLSIFLLIIPCTWSTYIENVAANVNNRGEKRHERFVPLVAFECGFRNKYMGEDGAWISDVNRWATCQSGKLDILKYCRKTYPKLDITNIVEYSHEMKISNWCHEEGTPCKWTHTVRPYQCVVGEFHSEALQVPHGCRFGHVNDRQSCSDYNHWKDVARKQCQSKMSDKKKMIVRSLAVLEPCGLDLFTGVEFVCCPDNKKSNDAVEKAVGLVDQNKDEDDDDDDDDYDDDYSDEDDDEERNNGGHFEPYLKAADSISEHERFKAAEQRLNRKHRVKVNKVMREWSELVARYKKMNETDPKGAEVFMREMTARYRKTIASLEEEKKENKKELEVEHEEAVQSRLNDKKRQATHDYRAALAVQVGAANKHNVLKALKTYIRMEEKDRTHMLNRYRHLLRTDQAEAETFKPILLHRLRYIDLRINGTLAMLRDFPELEKQVRSIAIEFWADYRRENTPEVTDDKFTVIGDDEQNAKLVQMYKDSYERSHRKSSKTTTSSPKPFSSKSSTLLGESSEDESRDGEDAAELWHSPRKSGKIAIEKIVKRPDSTKLSKPATVQSKGESVEDPDDDDDDDGDDSDVEGEQYGGGKSAERELHVEIEPIASEPVRVHDLPPRPAYAKHDHLIHDKIDAEHSSSSVHLGATNQLLLMIAASATIILTIFAIAVSRRRSRHAGFIEVDVCTPEERHVNGMQVNGYENPTYSFFDGKP